VEVTRRDCLNSSWFGVLDLGIYGAVRYVYERGVPGVSRAAWEHL
jgi:hypothetical protein